MFSNFVLLILLNAKNEVLLLKRTNTPFCNQCYSLPGGKIEIGETARLALKREAENSLNLQISLDNMEFVHIMYRKCNDPEFFACFFTIKDWNGIPINNEPDRYDDLRWFALNNLPKNIVPAHHYAIELFQQNILYSEHGWDKK